MRKVASRMHGGLAWVILAAVIAQFFFAGLGVFGAAGFGAHKMTGYLIEAASLILLILALAGRLGRMWTRLSALLFALTIVQSLLPSGPALVAAFHPLNAVAILFITLFLARRGMAVGASLRTAGL
ncbi:MAG: DUF6220 domain-containing protein [Chloroflexota bacterium]|nr:DUF6220 domain-containing protein [Chloroflexota bacterium]